MRDFAADLEQRRRDGLYRSRRILGGRQGAEIEIDGRRALSFCSNDYLGLAAEPRVVEAMQRGVRRYGVGAGAAHLISGHSRAHHQLEEELADFTGRERALLFSTGYMANLGVISALLERGDCVLEDRLNHASLIDGGLLSRAKLRRYRHGDAGALDQLLQADGGGAGERLAATDGVFSMDGDIAPIPALAEVCARRDAWLMVDDAHGLGVLGEQGRGSLALLGMGQAQVPILVGTLGKAFGTSGAFVAGSANLIETLIQRARSYVYTTAPPPAVAEATRESLRIARSEDWRRQRLAELVARFRAEAEGMGFRLPESRTPIQPLLAPDSATALAWSERLRAAGILVPAIRPPTVPADGARLRITFSAAHLPGHLDRLLEGLAGLRAER